MIRAGGGLIVELTDGIYDDLREWNFYYDLEKATNIRYRPVARPAASAAWHRCRRPLARVHARSEEVLDHFGLTEANWQDVVAKVRDLQYSETPFYVGRAVVVLAADPNVMRKSGQALLSGKLAREFGFADVDGTQPIWAYSSQRLESVADGVPPKTCGWPIGRGDRAPTGRARRGAVSVPLSAPAYQAEDEPSPYGLPWVRAT